MDSKNPGNQARPTRATLDAMNRRSRAENANLVDDPGLSVADDLDLGSDPYNSTGRHVIIKSRLNRED